MSDTITLTLYELWWEWDYDEPPMLEITAGSLELAKAHARAEVQRRKDNYDESKWEEVEANKRRFITHHWRYPYEVTKQGRVMEWLTIRTCSVEFPRDVLETALGVKIP